MKQFLFFAATLNFIIAQNHLIAQHDDHTTYQQCLKSAQDRYDDCIELATEMKHEGSEHVRQYSDAKTLLQGGCKNDLQKALADCKVTAIQISRQ